MIRRTFLKGAAAVSFSLMVSPALTAFAKDSVRVYVGGPIFTMNKNNDIAEAIAVKGETILAVGKKCSWVKSSTCSIGEIFKEDSIQ